jgi:predicted RNase H-like HicB family nuclease
MTRKSYTVVFEHGDRPGQWIAFVKGLPQCHTFGRSLPATRARIREALALWEGDAGARAELLEVLPLTKATRVDLGRSAKVRRKSSAP